MTDRINPSAVAAREAARHATGEFGLQPHTPPEHEEFYRALRDERTTRAARAAEGQNLDETGLAQLEEIAGVINNDGLLAHIAKRMPRHLTSGYYVEYDQKHDDDTIDRLLAGDDYALGDADEAADEMNGWAYQQDEQLARELIDGWDDWDDDLEHEVEDELRLIIGYHRDDGHHRQMLRNAGSVLVQYAPGDNPALMADKLAEHPINDADETVARDARRRALHEALTSIGIDMTEPANREAAEEMFENSPLGYQQVIEPESFRLQIVNYTTPDEVMLASLAHGQPDDVKRDPARRERTITTRDPHIFLADTWNGAGFDAQFTGTVESRLTRRNPARLDATAEYGSLDNLAGVYKPAYQSETTTTGWRTATAGDQPDGSDRAHSNA